jgi:hypothetical protein
VSVCSERVVLLWKKAQSDGSSAWSGPVFLRGKTYGAGLTLGFLNMRICLALMNDKGLSSVLRPHHNTALNCTFAVDMNGSRVRALRTSSAGAATQAGATAAARASHTLPLPARVALCMGLGPSPLPSFHARPPPPLSPHPPTHHRQETKNKPIHPATSYTQHSAPSLAPPQVQTDRSGGMQARYYLLEACILDVSANGGHACMGRQGLGGGGKGRVVLCAGVRVSVCGRQREDGSAEQLR